MVPPWCRWNHAWELCRNGVTATIRCIGDGLTTLAFRRSPQPASAIRRRPARPPRCQDLARHLFRQQDLHHLCPGGPTILAPHLCPAVPSNQRRSSRHRRWPTSRSSTFMTIAATSGDDDTTASAPLEEVPADATSKSKRSGGPRTARGKEISAKNSTRHGILSTSPVINLESEEDWEAHLEGMRASLKPVGHHEELLVRRAAFSMWRRDRVNDWAKGIVDAQLALVDLEGVFGDGPTEHPAPGAEWGITAATPALAALDALESQPDTLPLSAEGAAGIVA